MKIKLVNAFAGLGGNRKYWQGVQVTAIESNEAIAAVYKKLYPDDVVIIADAYQYILDHAHEFDFVWASPPCQSHSKMNNCNPQKPKNPDMRLYSLIEFLRSLQGDYVVENVVPYYKPPILPTARIGRHLFWSSFDFMALDAPKYRGQFIMSGNLAGRKKLQDWLGLHFDEILYYDNNHDPCQVLRNCVHPLVGQHIFNEFLSQNKQIAA